MSVEVGDSARLTLFAQKAELTFLYGHATRLRSTSINYNYPECTGAIRLVAAGSPLIDNQLINQLIVSARRYQSKQPGWRDRDYAGAGGENRVRSKDRVYTAGDVVYWWRRKFRGRSLKLTHVKPSQVSDKFGIGLIGFRKQN